MCVGNRSPRTARSLAAPFIDLAAKTMTRTASFTDLGTALWARLHSLEPETQNRTAGDTVDR